MAFPAWVYQFISPRSYTGEDLVEFHIPGNPLLARLLLDALIARGARQAEAGEFTARAYFNGRLDLAEAEGVAATIAAQNEGELRAARQLLAGELARRLRPVLETIAQTLALVEAGIDFSEEGVNFLSPAQIDERIGAAEEQLKSLQEESGRFEKLAHEPTVVLVGRPNAGKSTLLNALAGHERAIVSPVAGTTRDALWAEVALPRGMIRLIDIAGLEDAAGDDISRQMQERAQRELQSANLAILVHDITSPLPPLDLPRAPDLRVGTKLDLTPQLHSPSPGTPPSAGSGQAGEGGGGGNLLHALKRVAVPDEWPPPQPSPGVPGEGEEGPPGASGIPFQLAVSARTGAGMDQLRARLDELAFGRASAPPALALNARHLQAIAEARRCLARCRSSIGTMALETLALDLREALDALGTILGSVTPDDVLGRIFATFCIGK